MELLRIFFYVVLRLPFDVLLFLVLPIPLIIWLIGSCYDMAKYGHLWVEFWDFIQDGIPFYDTIETARQRWNS